MPQFSTAADVYGTIGELFHRMLADAELGPQVLGLGMAMQLEISKPDCTIVLDCRTGNGTVTTGSANSEADLTLSMTADNAHRLWLGELNPTIGIATRKIKASGDLMKAMGLAGILDPAAALYRDLLAESGRTDLLNT